MAEFVIPRIPASSGALIGDGSGRMLILKPTYKAGWTVPGGQIEADGESPWEACRREVFEETGLTVTSGKLVCVDFLHPKAKRAGGLRILFDCGTIAEEQKESIVLPPDEIGDYQWATRDEAVRLLSGPLGRRIAQLDSGAVYFEEGVPVAGVS
jgi:8-oxo-dGTP pyrophosphatase MutT (NUDIX family)